VSEDHRAARFVTRRSYPRVGVEVEVTMESEHQLYTGLTSNISEGGLFIATDASLALGTLLHVRLTVPGADQVIEASAEVRWRRDRAGSELAPGVGVKFVELDPAALAAVTSFVAVRDPLFYDDDPEPVTGGVPPAGEALEGPPARRRGRRTLVAGLAILVVLGATGAVLAVAMRTMDRGLRPSATTDAPARPHAPPASAPRTPVVSPAPPTAARPAAAAAPASPAVAPAVPAAPTPAVPAAPTPGPRLRRGPASLRVQCAVVEPARVRVDGVDTGLGCNTPRIYLQPGLHEVEVYFPRTGRTHREAVTLSVRPHSTYVRVPRP
jgi:uncharacterized protein (TIGR02266 family)